MLEEGLFFQFESPQCDNPWRSTAHDNIFPPPARSQGIEGIHISSIVFLDPENMLKTIPFPGREFYEGIIRSLWYRKYFLK